MNFLCIVISFTRGLAIIFHSKASLFSLGSKELLIFQSGAGTILVNLLIQGIPTSANSPSPPIPPCATLLRALDFIMRGRKQNLFCIIPSRYLK